MRQCWESPSVPKEGDFGSWDEHDAVVEEVDHKNETVTITVYFDHEAETIELPYIIR